MKFLARFLALMALVLLPLSIVGPIAAACGITATIVGATVLLVVLVGFTLMVPSVTKMRAPVAVG